MTNDDDKIWQSYMGTLNEETEKCPDCGCNPDSPKPWCKCDHKPDKELEEASGPAPMPMPQTAPAPTRRPLPTQPDTRPPRPEPKHPGPFRRPRTRPSVKPEPKNKGAVREKLGNIFRSVIGM